MDPTALLRTALDELRSAGVRAISDEDLLELARRAAKLQQSVAAFTAIIAGEIAHRSDPALGSAGLAQRTGHRTPQELLRVTTGSTSRDASTAVRVGLLPDTHPWLPPILSSTPAAADAISVGLGVPAEGVTTSDLAAAAARLAADTTTLDADRLLRRARELRDELDAAGIADRERARHAQRALRFHRRPDGMSHLSWTMDPETAAIVGELYDRATSPRRGGPRFVQNDDLADRIADDERSTDQLASDVFSELLRQGSAADSSHLLGTGAPQVRVIVAEPALSSRSSHGFLEGQPDPVSIQTIERSVCSGGTTAITLGAAAQPLDVGREQRLYTRRQRIALAARDGGCRWPGCERPPSWTEAHHIQQWKRDGGRTDLADGILLCRHHHLLGHNNRWEILRVDHEYWLIPPPDIDPEQKAILMPTHSRAMREMTA